MKKVKILLIFCLICSVFCGCLKDQLFDDKTDSTAYGVFLDYDGDLERLSDYDYLVIDASYYDESEIKKVSGPQRHIYSYINIGSLENFRDYYDDFRSITLGDYENWEEEKWIDVSDKRWQDFILNELAPEFLSKGISGFFVDNVDVYYMYPTDEIFDGLTAILKGLKEMDCDVIVNGGDTYLDIFTERGGDPEDIITGINQECVFTGIDWENERLIESKREDRGYFSEYIEKYAQRGMQIFMIEYVPDGDENNTLRKDIRAYAKDHGFMYYIADSIKLNVP
ncbi:MAG: endo alpha-1,4 polygalactosaminidase [Lachnospiraceae bacterium]|nr:endo alpha-1,4 polygalactosaminidase [Lachnospiraceae bacterium]